jgi:chromosome segregation protein
VLAAEGLAELEQAIAELEAERVSVQERLRDIAGLIQSGREQAHHLQAELNARRAEQHARAGKISSLETLQEYAMGKDRKVLQRWLAEHGLAQLPRLAEQLEVHPGWETAVETALGAQLQALCLEQTHPVLPALAGLSGEALALFETRPAPPPTDTLGPRLLERVNSPWNLNPLLGAIHCAENLQSAHAMSARLGEHESVITPDGTRLGPGWLVRQPLGGHQAGVILRERELKTLKLEQREAAERLAELEQEHLATEHAIREAERERESLQTEERRLNSEHGKARSELSATRARCEQSAKRLRQLLEELADVEALGDEQRDALTAAHELRLEAEERLSGLERRRPATPMTATGWKTRLTEADAALRQARARVNALNSRAESLRASAQLTRRHLERARVSTSKPGSGWRRSKAAPMRSTSRPRPRKSNWTR